MVALEPARVKGILYLVLTISEGYIELHPQEITLTFLVNRMHVRYLPPSQGGTGQSDFLQKHLELCTVRLPKPLSQGGNLDGVLNKLAPSCPHV